MYCRSLRTTCVHYPNSPLLDFLGLEMECWLSASNIYDSLDGIWFPIESCLEPKPGALLASVSFGVETIYLFMIIYLFILIDFVYALGVMMVRKRFFIAMFTVYIYMH